MEMMLTVNFVARGSSSTLLPSLKKGIFSAIGPMSNNNLSLIWELSVIKVQTVKNQVILPNIAVEGSGKTVPHVQTCFKRLFL
jgi:hypothetical protein